MTQRVARPMKFAAFISIIVSAAVMFVACQGAVGPAGETGPKGDTGDTGPAGPQGPAAPLPLTGRIGPVLLDSLNAGDDQNESTAYEVDLLDDGYFNGGEAPYEFEVTVPADIAANLTAEIDDDTNMLDLELTYDAATTTYNETQYMDGFTVTVSAEDANGEKAESSVTIKPNRAPLLATGVTDSDGDLSGENALYVLGIMEGTIDITPGTDGNQPRIDGAASCSTFNQCELTLFQDDGDYEVSVSSDADGVKFSWTQEDGKLTLTGLESTWDADAATPAFVPVEVDVTAEDEGGLSLEVTFTLNVNAPPGLSDLAADVETDVEFELGTTGNTLITQAGAVALFDDPEDDTVAATFESSNDSIISVDANSGAVTPVSRGQATITVTGTTGEVNTEAGLGQSAEIEYSITVN